MNAFLSPMNAWPGLKDYGSFVKLPGAGINLHCFDSQTGEGTPVLLIHGLGDEADTWRHLFPSLARRRRVLAPDLPGFGRSDKPKIQYRILYYEQVISELLDQAEIKQVILVGHSMGALIAHHFALEYPERVVRLVLLSGSLAAGKARPDVKLLLYILPLIGEWAYNRLRRDPQRAYASLEPYYRNLSALPQEERDFLYRRVNQRVWSNDQRDAFLSALRGLAGWLPAQQEMLSDRLRNLMTPTTVIWGQADRIVSVETGRALARLQPTARLVEIPGAAHNLHQEDPVEVLVILEHTLEGR